ncbi:type II toxin-antitoxin system RelB/DinJ family antitoxin [Companilactobacillus muriivasis]|uniref:type II toxin-antitoxin system RelB/DinJ family antitoxin n=1 Tax=Companilactobacillus muriivasis TaxID=3081444 RepID=UPI0030C71068
MKSEETSKVQISTTIDHNIKIKAQDILANNDLTISEYLEIALIDVANNGLPKYFVNPSSELTASILEANEVINNHKNTPNIATTREELNRKLNS